MNLFLITKYKSKFNAICCIDDDDHESFLIKFITPE